MHIERHHRREINWLRAAVLGANDGIVSTGALVIGVAAAGSSRTALAIAAFAGVIAGACSMAVGEYSSVSSQRDSEHADVAKEMQELSEFPRAELAELTGIYEKRGLSRELATQVAVALTEQGALEAHLRDELGINEITRARPLQAAIASAISFMIGALLPVFTILLSSHDFRIITSAVASVIALGLLGYWSARLGGARWQRAVLRIVVGGSAAMIASALLGDLVGAIV